MKHLLRILPVVLAAVLQLMPLLRNIVTSPAAGSTFAIILRWGLGSAATVGAFDACSGASIPAKFTSTNKFNLTVGIYFSNTVVAYLGDSGQASSTDYFFLQSGAVSSPVLGNAQTTTNTMPLGISFRTFWTNNANTIYAAIYGIPTTPGTFTNMTSVTSPAHGSIITNLSFIVSNAVLAVLPTITNNPIGLTNVAGASGSFSVTAGGTTPLAYQWRFAAAAIAGATNTSLSLTNIRSSQSGNYTVVITNSAGAITSSVAILAVTNPLPRQLTAPSQTGNNFQFTFIPTVGLTNTVQANNSLNSGTWVTFTNVPPPLTASPITVTDTLGSSNKYYRVQLIP